LTKHFSHQLRDAGQEGELIQRWVMNEAQYKGEVQRLWISSLTTEAIKRRFNNLKPAANYDNLYYAGFSRAIGDWFGMNATDYIRLNTVALSRYYLLKCTNANTSNGCGSF
jgi:DNA topoisomerase IA